MHLAWFDLLGERCEAVCARAAIGSGGGYALAAARALIDLPDLKALDIGARPEGRKVTNDS